MARRLIGLDVGTNAVAVAEVAPGDPPTLRAFGQVALPPDAMREGEVLDVAAVAEAVARLRSEIGLRRGSVRLGIASPRVIVRQVDMPEMSENDLRSALQFQAQDLIPIPVEEAVLDSAILGREVGEDGEGTMRVLLAAAQRSSVVALVESVEAAGLGVESVDLVPLALVRAIGRTVSDNGPGAEGIVSFGGGVTVVVVHEAGVPAFVRVLGTGGRDLTASIAADLDVPEQTAEALKRQLGDASTGDEVEARAQAALERPLGALLDEVRSSLDYYRNQPGATRLLRVLATGGGSQLPGLADRLTTLIGVPVQLARPRENLAIGDIGFDEEDLPRLDPYLAAPVGLAIGDSRGGLVIDLLARPSRVAGGRGRVVAGGIAAAAVLVGALAIPTIARNNEIDDEKAALAAAEATNAQLQAQIADLADAQAKQATLETAQAQINAVLATDVSWSRMLQEISRAIPNDVWLESFDGAVTPDATTITGPVSFGANGLEYPSAAAWLTRVAEIPSLTDLWVESASKGAFGVREIVSFSSSAELTDDARSDRAEAMGAVADLEGTAQDSEGSSLDDSSTPTTTEEPS